MLDGKKIQRKFVSKKRCIQLSKERQQKTKRGENDDISGRPIYECDELYYDDEPYNVRLSDKRSLEYGLHLPSELTPNQCMSLNNSDDEDEGVYVGGCFISNRLIHTIESVTDYGGSYCIKFNV